MAETNKRRGIPTEILNDIARKIPDFRALCTFARCNTLTYKIANPLLWEREVLRSKGKPALYWAIENNDHATITKALDMYASAGATGLLDGTGVDFESFWWADGRGAMKNMLSPAMLAVEVGTLETLRLIVTHPAGCNLNMRRTPGSDSWGTAHLVSCQFKSQHLEVPCRCWLHKECERYTCKRWDRIGTFMDFMCCETALHLAIKAQSTAKLRLLLDAGAELPSPDDIWHRCRATTLEELVEASFRGTFAEGGMVHQDMMNIVKAHNERREILAALEE
ncbi:uncharacterized protein B0H64DRAFT_478770 [Chaetomium fimeti]|uniref:Uncharacterized protein n=1 Tax=Chaetomium fimeti TaxID=1854472 RepID=A0AAE0H6S7_9PEZI|nr:hypothetical protein B0H64DRAFT_478770 [Chaetomium fimeti]